MIKNIVPNINMGYETPNIKRLVSTVAHVLGIQNAVHVMPMKIKRFDEYAYAVKQGCEYMIFVSENLLRMDKINSNFMVGIIIHEMCHIKQMIDGRLEFNDNHTMVVFEGKEYTNDTPHWDRPFEKEARDAERLYMKRVKDLLNS